MISTRASAPRPRRESPDERHDRYQAEPNRWAILALLGVAQLMVVLDATIVNIALPSAQKAPAVLHRQPAVGRDRVRAGLREPAAARRKARRPVRTQMDLHRGPGRLLARLRARRSRPVVRHAGRRPGAAGGVRRAAGAVGPVAVDGDVRRLAGPRQGVRDLRRDRRRRRVDRPRARRRADPGALVALVPVRQPRDRRPDRARGAAAAEQPQRPQPAAHRHSRRRVTARWACSPSSTDSRTPRPTRGRRR